MNKNYYYDIAEDLKNFPDAWCYLIYGGRNTGKTYGALNYEVQNHQQFAYLKRTKDDVGLLCTGGGKKAQELQIDMDLSPFVSLNRDKGWNIRATSITDEVGVFLHYDEDNKPIPNQRPVGYILALSVVGKYRGFDLSTCKHIILDEFVPARFERKMPKEGESLLDLYKTVSRDREHRGQDALKLICLSNANDIVCPLVDTLEVMDDIVQLKHSGKDYIYNEERGIFIRCLEPNEEFKQRERNTAIAKGMKGTKWFQSSIENEFAFNDFSKINKAQLRYSKPLCKYYYKRTWNYVYYNEDRVEYYVTERSTNNQIPDYNLDIEGDVILFGEVRGNLVNAIADGNIRFDKYSQYNLIMDYWKIFKRA